MNLKSITYRRAAETFRITQPDHWCRISAADVLAVDKCGKKFLNQLRLYLAHRGISLRGDNPPSYWLDTLDRPAGDDNQVIGVCPFTVVIDTNETFPFPFDSIMDREGNPVSVPVVRRPLYTAGFADYTISGMECDIQLERKGDDLPSSLTERRENFEDEIRRLSEMCEFAAVIIEHPEDYYLTNQHDHGASGKSISRTIISWRIMYPGVHWLFCHGRYHAEQVAFRLMEKFFWMKMRSENERV